MIMIAVVAIVLGITIDRRNRFRKMAVHHQAVLMKLARRMKPFADDRSWLPLEWHESMGRKYERAARFPFLPVAADPPEPE
jgi:hypothetical protein